MDELMLEQLCLEEILKHSQKMLKRSFRIK